MPKSPWRCSECGTVNEPVATSCRTCGRWPSLFDLQESAVGADVEDGGGAGASRVSVEPADSMLAPYEPEPDEDDALEVEPPATRPEVASPSPAGGRSRNVRRIVRLLIPVVVFLYLLISSHFRSH